MAYTKNSMSAQKYWHIYNGYLEALKRHQYEKARSILENTILNENVVIKNSYKPFVSIDVLIDYAKCLAVTGNFKSALLLLKKIEEVIVALTYFNKENDLKEICEIYARCGAIKEVERIIEQLEQTISLDSKYYEFVARSCDYAQEHALALALYEKTEQKALDELVESNDYEQSEKLRILIEKIQNAKEKMQLYLDNPNAESPCSYGKFVNSKKDFTPGRVIAVPTKNLNIKGTKAELAELPKQTILMIWKVEEITDEEGRVKERYVYAFPLKAIMDGNTNGENVISRKNHIGIEYDRRLKDHLYKIPLDADNITTVGEQLTEEDYQIAIETIYKTIGYSKKGDYKAEPLLKFFMKEILKGKKARKGDTLLIKGYYYYVISIDEEKGQYNIVPLANLYHNKPLQAIPIEMTSELIQAILPTLERNREKVKSSITVDGQSNINKIISYNGRTLLIVDETKTSFLCIDISENNKSKERVFGIISLNKETGQFTITDEFISLDKQRTGNTKYKILRKKLDKYMKK